MSNWREKNKVGGRCCFCGHQSSDERFYLIKPHGWACTSGDSCADNFFESKRAKKGEWRKVAGARPKAPGIPSNVLEHEQGVIT